MPHAPGGMTEYWDARAAEDAFYFVDNRLRYGHPDLERFWASGRGDLDRMLDQLGTRVTPTDDVVEIGCGVGRITRVLAERARSVRALDVSSAMLDLAREHNRYLDNVEWILGDGVSLAPIATDSANVCHSHVVFQHVPDPQITLGYVREIGRVLRPGGWAAFQVSNSPDIHRPPRGWRRLRASALALLGRAPRGQAHAAWLGSWVALDALEAAAVGAGASLERVVGAGTQWCLVLLRKPAG